MQTPVFSIITVTFNAEQTIERTMQSVAAQTYSNIEYIIVDGASTDKTLAIINDFQTSLQGTMPSTFSFQLISEPDNGLYDAMNKAIIKASGDYLWFLNAGDEIYDKDTIMRIYDRMPSNALPDILYGETNIVDINGAFISRRRLRAPKKLNWKSFRMGMLVSHQSFIAKREIAPLYDLKYRYSADVDWCIRCMKVAGTIFNTHCTLCNYLNEGLTTANRKASLKERFSIMVKHYGWGSTIIHHFWFFIRFYYKKLLKMHL